ncbi:unnamed protein product [Symbiodinium necroappetens]|uniref:PDZ domain-containing protein n=1 Tax=Symbiodinium necroappetens TaxID=1628268 RepID=A0A813BPL6_9DINO|nr:unnamed protein product [Symbiodinium necroappetens]
MVTPPTSEDLEAQPGQLRRIGAGVGHVVHGLIFEFDGGIRKGCLLDDDCAKMDICDDVACKKRKVKWHSVAADDFIFKVCGYGSKPIQETKMFLCHTVTFTTRLGKTITFEGKKKWKKGDAFPSLKAGKDFEICRLIFSEGCVIGALERPLVASFPQHLVKADETGSLGFHCPEFPREDGIRVHPGGWAETEGLRNFDSLVKVSGKLTREMRSSEELQAALSARPLKLTFMKKVPHKATSTDELQQVKLVEGSASLDTCADAVLNEGNAAPGQSGTTEMQPQPQTAPKKRNRWQRGVDPLRQPIPHHRPVEFTGGLEAMPAAERRPAPDFDPASCGGPYEWNLADIAGPTSSDRVLAWGANARYQLPQPPSSKACDSDVDRFLKSFFETRKGPDGKSLESLLGEPAAGLQLRRLRVLVWFMCFRLDPSQAPYSDGWWRIPWMPMEDTYRKLLRQGGWQRGWHGCKMEALYSIIYHGELFPSSDESKGDRMLAGCPGVYLHRDSLHHKAERRKMKVENYMRWIPMCGDGLFWAAKWEVVYASWGSVKRGKRTDQVIQSAESVELAALWLSVRSASMLPEGTPVQAKWSPEREANPRWNQSRRRTSALMALEDLSRSEPAKGLLALEDWAAAPAVKEQQAPSDLHLWPTLGEADSIDKDAAAAKRLARKCSQSSRTPSSSAGSSPVAGPSVPPDSVPTRRWDRKHSA